MECCTAPIVGLVHCEVRGGRYWLSSPIRPCQWLCGVICGAVYDCHTAGAIRREDVTHIGVIISCIAVVKDDGIVWYEPVVATEDSPTWAARGCVYACSGKGVSVKLVSYTEN